MSSRNGLSVLPATMTPASPSSSALCPANRAREYLRGRIARYIPPLRLYLATSVVFFLLLSLSEAAVPGRGTNVSVTQGVWRTGAKYLLLGGSYLLVFSRAASLTFLLGLLLI